VAVGGGNIINGHCAGSRLRACVYRMFEHTTNATRIFRARHELSPHLNIALSSSTCNRTWHRGLIIVVCFSGYLRRAQTVLAVRCACASTGINNAHIILLPHQTPRRLRTRRVNIIPLAGCATTSPSYCLRKISAPLAALLLLHRAYVTIGNLITNA